MSVEEKAGRTEGSREDGEDGPDISDLDPQWNDSSSEILVLGGRQGGAQTMWAWDPLSSVLKVDSVDAREAPSIPVHLCPPSWPPDIQLTWPVWRHERSPVFWEKLQFPPSSSRHCA